MSLRLMQQADMPTIMRIQADCYLPEMVEAEPVFRARLDAASNHAWVAEDSEGVCAYLFCYPSTLNKVTPLGAHFEVPDHPNCLYVHDLAVSRRAKGQNLGISLINLAWQAARDNKLSYSALVSVQDSKNFWERLGYREFGDLSLADHLNLDTYATPAWYMVKTL